MESLFTSFQFWVIFSAALVLAELVVLGTFLIWLGISGFVTSGLLYVFGEALPTFVYPLVWASLSTVVTAIYHKCFKDKYESKKEVEKSGLLESLKGETGTVIGVDGGVIRAKVRDTTWKVVVENHEAVAVGENVIVKDLDGLVLTVAKN